MGETPRWTASGTYGEACTCDAICPCITLSDPTQGTCTALVGWHIARGRFGDVALDGLNVALAVHTPGNMANGHWRAALYLDERASSAQRDALAAIWGGQAGGHPGELAKLIGEVAGVSAVPISFETDGRRGALRVGTVGQAQWEPVEGPGGEPVVVEHHPLAVAPGFPAVVGRSTAATFHDAGVRFDVRGRSALGSPFEYAGP